MIHVRKQYNRWSFRLRALDNYIDAGESYSSEEEAGFAADLAKHYLRTFFHVTKNVEPSLDGEVFSMLAYRASVDLSSRSSIEDALAPGVRAFLEENRVALDAFAEINRLELRDWEKLRSHDDSAIRQWCHQCEAASIVAGEYAAVNSGSFFTRLSVVDRSLDASLKSLALAVRLHGDPVPTALILRVTDLTRLIDRMMQTQDEVRELTTRLRREQTDAESALPALEANRPPLT